MSTFDRKEELELLYWSLLSKAISKEPSIQRVTRLFAGIDQQSITDIENQVNEKLKNLVEIANQVLDNQQQMSTNSSRIYIDGGFDLLHSGHYNAIRQARAFGDVVVAGINSDADLLKNKGPTIMNCEERSEILRHCKFVDEVVPDTPYTPTISLLDELNCHSYAHGDDPTFDSEGVDITQVLREHGRFKVFKRTEGVSTTDITGRLLELAKSKMNKSQDQIVSKPIAPLQQFLATSRRIINFANHNLPKADDTIVYIQGSFDLLHHGHLKRLELAKKLGSFLYVGLWDDQMTRFYKGEHYPIIHLQERVLMTLACKHVDDVVIGAPFVITNDLITSLNIKKVVVIKNTEEDTVLSQFQNLDQFAVPRSLGILEEIEIVDDFYDLTTEKIAMRVFNNQEAFQKKFDKKAASLAQYYANSKTYLEEQ